MALLAFSLCFLFHSPWFHAEGRQLQLFKRLELIISLFKKTILLKVICPEELNLTLTEGPSEKNVLDQSYATGRRPEHLTPLETCPLH